MLTQKINLQTLPPNTNISRAFLKAKHFGFQFKAAEKKHMQCVERKEEIIEDLGEHPKPFKMILSILCIIVAIVFAYIEALKVHTTIVGAVGISDNAAMAIGVTFALAGLITGHLLATSWKRDEFTQSNKPTPYFYIGVVLTLVYLAGQYYLASRAGVNTGEDMQETVTTMKWFVLGIAISEVLFGVAFLGMAIKVLTLLIANIRIKFALTPMNKHSRACEESWQRYSFEHKGQNLLEQTPAIVDARAFYNNGGYDDAISFNSII